MMTVEMTTTANPPRDKSDDSDLLQSIIDQAAGRGGGDCELPAGDWVLRRPLELRSGVRVTGAPAGTTLRPVPCQSVALAAEAGYGLYSVRPMNPDLFRVGDAIHVTDDNAGGFYDTNAVVKQVSSAGALILDRPLVHDYLRRSNALISTVFPAIRGEDVERAMVSQLCVRGPKSNPRRISGCRGGGVFLQRCHDVVIDDVSIEEYPGDGISFQHCYQIHLHRCTVFGNQGHGLHPGAGSTDTRIESCRVESNGGHGLFFCKQVCGATVAACTFSRNRYGGMSLGGESRDNTIRDCTIQANGGPGVAWRPHDELTSAHRNVFQTCHIHENCLESGEADVVIVGEVAGVSFIGCVIEPSSTRPAVSISEDSADVFMPRTEIRGAVNGDRPKVQAHSDLEFSERQDNKSDLSHLGGGIVEKGRVC